MDDAWLGGIEIATDKACTCDLFRDAHTGLASQVQPGQPLSGIHTTGNSRVVISAGGIPIKRDGRVVADF